MCHCVWACFAGVVFNLVLGVDLRVVCTPGKYPYQLNYSHPTPTPRPPLLMFWLFLGELLFLCGLTVGVISLPSPITQAAVGK